MLETIFGLSNLFVLPFWGLMIFAPGWRWTSKVMRSLLPIAGLGALYAVLLVSQIGGAAGALLSPSAAGIAALLGTPAGVTVVGSTSWPLISSLGAGPISTAVSAG